MEYMLQNNIHNTLKKLLDPHTASSIPQKHLNYLWRYLSEREEDLGCTGTPKIDESFFFPWIKQAVDKWTIIGSNNVPPNILMFVSELTTSMCATEKIFVKLNFTGILDDFIRILRSIPEQSNTAQIKLCYVKLISSFLLHKSGMQWVMVTNFWFDIYTMISQCPVKEVSEQSCRFIVTLLGKSQGDNEMFCCNVIEVIISPLKDLTAIYSLNSPAEKDALLLSLNILNRVLENILIQSCIMEDFRVYQLLNEKFNLDNNLSNLVATIQNQEIFSELIKTLMVILSFPSTECLVKKYDHFSTEEVNRRYRILEMLINITCSHGASKSLEIIYFSHILMKNITSNMNDKMLATASHNKFHQQMLLFILRPVHYFTMEILETNKIIENDELREQLSNKILTGLIPATFEAYSKLYAAPIRFSVQDATLSLNYLVTCSQFYNTKTANTATQIIIYIMVDILNSLKAKPEVISTMSQEFLVSLLETITILLKNFNLSWKDSVENIFLTETIEHFLNFFAWPTKVVVKALQLLDIGISKSLSPSMALLIDESDKNVDFITIVYNKVSDPQWEVRNAAIQVTTTIIRKTKKNFESHKKSVVDADFPTIIFNAAMLDPEIQVKISAIRCLQEMATIKEIWMSLLKNVNLYGQILQLYSSQSDGIVRSEVIILIKKIYRNQQLNKSVVQKFCDNMVNTVLEDQNNLVKIKGLEFWQGVIESSLENQGMIDGQFPKVTFSKTSKKIVILDENAIKTCLVKILDELSKNGCLTAFLFAVHHTDEELRIHGTKLVKKFVDILKHYLFPSHSAPTSNTSANTLTYEPLTNNSRQFSSPTTSVPPSLEDFCEDIADLEELINGTTGTLNNNSSCVIYKDYSSPGSEKDIQKNAFLKFVLNYNFYEKEEILRKEKLKDDIESIINQILNL